MVALRVEDETRDSGEIGVRRVASSLEWEQCRIQQRGATPFHRWEWLRTVAGALGKHFLPLGFYQSGDLVGLAPLLVRQWGPYKSATWAPLPYLGPLVPRFLLPLALGALDVFQKRNGIGIVQFGFAPDADVAAVYLTARGFSVSLDRSMVLQLAGRTETDILAAMKYQRRQNLRRAQAAAVEVGPATRLEMKRDLAAIMSEVFAGGDQPPPYPAIMGGLIWDGYNGDPNVHMTAARVEGKTAAILVTLRDRDRAYMWAGGGLSRYRQQNPNALLYWDAIQWALARGCTNLDMVATPDEGIARFKAGFGCVETPYLVACRVDSRVAGWMRQAHTAAVSLRREMPTRSRAISQSLRAARVTGLRVRSAVDVVKPSHGSGDLTRQS